MIVAAIVASAMKANIASAHVVQTDGSVSVLFHVDPDDDPVIGEQALLWFSVDDITSRFDPAQCDCRVSIIREESNEQLLNMPLLALTQGPSIFNYQIPFTFPEAGVYLIVITGSPKSANAFQPFTLQYDLRVTRQKGSSPSLSALLGHSGHLLHVIIVGGGTIITVIVFTVMYERDKRRLRAMQEKQNNHLYDET